MMRRLPWIVTGLLAVGLGAWSAPAEAAPPPKKVKLCHYSPGRAAPIDIEVSDKAVQDHLSHGDFQGTCAQDCRQQPSVCQDNNACTTDTCDTSNGVCRHPALVCNDGNTCTSDSCDPQTGCVQTAVSCDDRNACTADSCDASSGCQHTPVSCNDNSACTTDSCDPSTGCVFSRINCNDSNACTTDSCDPTTGCVYATAICDDNNVCTTDSCNPSTGCGFSAVSCDDGNPCTADSCSPTSGCGHEPVVCPSKQFCEATTGDCQALPYTLVQTSSGGCVPYNYIDLQIGTGASSFDAAFVACAQQCERTTGCVQIWVGYVGETGKTGPYTCLTGAVGESSKGWNSSEIQCGLRSPYPPFGEWYTKN